MKLYRIMVALVTVVATSAALMASAAISPAAEYQDGNGSVWERAPCAG
jgi:hypothetical protein